MPERSLRARFGRAAAAAGLVCALALAACGDDDGGGETKTVTVTRTATAPSPPAATTPATPGGLSPLTAAGLGPVRLGMTKPEAEAALGVSLAGGGEFCDQPASGPEGIFFEYGEGRRIAAIGVEGPARAIPTDRGLRLGDPVSRARSLYGGELRQVTADPDQVAQGTDFVVREPGEPNQLNLSSVQGRITSMHAVRAGDVRDEYCA